VLISTVWPLDATARRRRERRVLDDGAPDAIDAAPHDDLHERESTAQRPFFRHSSIE
jgi:hypothetical protein